MIRHKPKIAIPREIRARQAIDSLQGYVYQLYASAQAWLSLEKKETLLIEVAEDYAIVSANALKGVQVKKAARSVTLRSSSVVTAINNFWRIREANPNLRVQSVYLSTSSIGREHQTCLPQGIPGLIFWGEAAKKRKEIREFRKLLDTLPLTIDLRAWMATANDDDLREHFLKCIRWECGALPLPALAGMVRDAVICRCENFGIFPSEARRVLDAMLIKLLQTAATTNDDERLLTRVQLNEVIEGTSTVLMPARKARVLVGRYARLGPADDASQAYQPPLHLRQRESDGGRLFFFASKDRIPFLGRDEELLRLRHWLNGAADFSWMLVTGSGGIGKSRLALELCLEAHTQGWEAGFLTGGSAASDPERFAQFRPQRPTLAVIDYVAEEPKKSGDIVRTLIDLSIVNAFNHPVRFLLLDRGAEGSIWWPTFTERHTQRMEAYGTRLELRGLDDDLLWRIVQHVTGDPPQANRKKILQFLRQIDSSGRPLFAALAGDAIKNGKNIWQFSKSGLLNDVLLREQRRWNSLAGQEDKLILHENAAALATMVGGLRIPSDTQILPSEHFPFGERYDQNLMAQMTGEACARSFIQAIVPDVVGEYFVLQLLSQQHPFDERPRKLMEAAELRALSSHEDAILFGSFRSRVAEDFPSEASRTDLFRPPPPNSPAWTVTEWAMCLADALHYSCIDERAATDALVTLSRHRLSAAADKGLYIASGEVYYGYSLMMADRGWSDASTSAFLELLILSQIKVEFPELGWAASHLGRRLGCDRLAAGDLTLAIELLQLLRDHASRFQAVYDAEREEIAEDAAWLGLSIRQYYVVHDNKADIATLDKILWDRPSSDQGIDLADRAGMIMMKRSDDGGLGTSEDIFKELKTRSLARPDVPEIAFWAANVGFGIARNSKEHRQFVEAVSELREWLQPRAEWPDIDDVISDSVHNEWITDDFRLGRRSIEALFELWNAALDAAQKRRGNTDLDNEVRSAREDLENALAAQEDSAWASEIRKRIRARKKSLPESGG